MQSSWKTAGNYFAKANNLYFIDNIKMAILDTAIYWFQKVYHAQPWFFVQNRFCVFTWHLTIWIWIWGMDGFTFIVHTKYLLSPVTVLSPLLLCCVCLLLSSFPAPSTLLQSSHCTAVSHSKVMLYCILLCTNAHGLLCFQFKLLLKVKEKNTLKMWRL